MHHDAWKFSRRDILKAGSSLAALALAGGVTAPARAADEEITIFTWETYHDDAWLAQWTQKSGVKVNAVRTGSVDEMYAKTRSGAIDADILYFDVGSIPRYVDAKLIAPVDAAKVANTGNISAGLKWQERGTLNGQLWAVPYNWGTQPLMFNTSIVTPKPDSWAVLWDAKYAGQVNVPDDAYITFPMIALYVGAKDPYNLTEDEFEKCKTALKELRNQIRTIARGFDDATTLYAAGDASLGYCQNISSVFQLQGQGKPFDYSFPKEGTPTWIDCAVLTPKGAARKVVYDFIGDNLTLDWQSRFIQASFNNGILGAARAGEAKIPDDVLKKTNILAQEMPGFWDKMSILKNPENIDRRLEIWNAFKAGTL